MTDIGLVRPGGHFREKLPDGRVAEPVPAHEIVVGNRVWHPSQRERTVHATTIEGARTDVDRLMRISYEDAPYLPERGDWNQTVLRIIVENPGTASRSE